MEALLQRGKGGGGGGETGYDKLRTINKDGHSRGGIKERKRTERKYSKGNGANTAAGDTKAPGKRKDTEKGRREVRRRERGEEWREAGRTERRRGRAGERKGRFTSAHHLATVWLRDTTATTS